MRADNLRLRVVEVREGERTRVELRGDLDTVTVLALAIRLRRLRDRRESVLLELDHLTFIDVRGEMNTVAAISLSVQPPARRRRISCSRLPSSGLTPLVSPRDVREYALSRWPASIGEMIEPPP